ncbi:MULTISPECIES: hypothetical protein [Rhodococcus]|jgi:hypothetical protein|uniref:hypothetical protein n=1 Tax=Rhodococcus TaxID=1827 RepID=UPI001ED947A2|nr:MULTISPECIES: hypothetical protein [Rhodococcus]
MDLRPMRSPKWPTTTPPIGRAMKPTENVANAASVPAMEEKDGKNNGPNTIAAAMP